MDKENREKNRETKDEQTEKSKPPATLSEEKEGSHPGEQSNHEKNAREKAQDVSLVRRFVRKFLDVRITDVFIAGATITIAWATIQYTSYARGQWQEMQSQVRAMRTGVELAKGQLQETRKTAEAAQRSAEAAERNVEAAVEFLRLEQRAWVGITIIKMRTEFRPEEPIRFEVRVENTGITPALCIVVKKIVSSDPPNENTIDAPIDEPEPTKIVISPRNAFSGLTKPIRLTEKEVEVVRKKRARIYVFGTIHYRDIFDRKHKTTYCTFYTAEHHPNVEFCPWFNHMD